MLKIVRTDSENQGFIQLVTKLDELLAKINGREHDFYNQYNKIDAIKHTVVVFSDGIPVACGAMKQFDAEVMEVKRMFTNVDYRGNKLATIVINELESWAKELGYKKCVLETGVQLEGATMLYQKNGYKRIPNYGQYVNAPKSICFQKELVKDK